MFDFLCECLQSLQNPSISEILNVLQRSTVCTQTQCFDNAETAGFGQIITRNDTDTNFMLTVTYFMMISVFLRYSMRSNVSSIRQK